jgi:hypothetical protein
MPLQPPIGIDANYIKLTMIINTPTKVVTESHLKVGAITGTPTFAALQTALADANGWLVSRAQMLPAGCNLNEVRASVENVAGATAVNTTYINIVGTEPAVENVGNDCLKLRLEGGNSSHTNISLAAIPDDCIASGKYVINPASAPTFDNLVKTYFTNLCNGYQLSTTAPRVNSAWGFLGLDPTQLRIKVVSAIATVAGFVTTLTITTSAGITVAPGDVVRLGKIPGASSVFPVNQLWQVATVIDATHFTIATSPSFLPAGNSTGPGGYVRKLIYTCIPYNNAVMLAPGTRRRGSRTGKPLGRFKKKRTVGY